MKLYALIHDPAGERVNAYAGMDQTTVMGLIQEMGFTFDFIDEATYAAFILAHQPVPLTGPQILALVHSQAVAGSVTGLDPLTTLQRAVILLILEEFNILHQRDRDRSVDVAAATTLADLKTRWAARSNLADRTVAQLKTAIQNKINAGDAD